MSKCRYDIEKDCDNTDCVKCILENISKDVDYELHECPYHYDENHLEELYSYQEGLEYAENVINGWKDKVYGKDIHS